MLDYSINFENMGAIVPILSYMYSAAMAKDWAILEAGQTGGGGGGGIMAPLEISAVDRAIAAKICTMVVCDVIYKTVYLDFPKKLSFI